MLYLHPENGERILVTDILAFSQYRGDVVLKNNNAGIFNIAQSEKYEPAQALQSMHMQYIGVSYNDTKLSPKLANLALELLGFVFDEPIVEYPFLWDGVSRKLLKYSRDHLSVYSPKVERLLSELVFKYVPVDKLTEHANALYHIAYRNNLMTTVNKELRIIMEEYSTGYPYHQPGMWILFMILEQHFPPARLLFISRVFLDYHRKFGTNDYSPLDGAIKHHQAITADVLAWLLSPYVILYDRQAYVRNLHTNIWGISAELNMTNLVTEIYDNALEEIEDTELPDILKGMLKGLIDTVTTSGVGLATDKLRALLTCITNPFLRQSNMLPLQNCVLIGGDEKVYIRAIHAADMVTTTSSIHIPASELKDGEQEYEDKSLYTEYITTLFPDPDMREMSFRCLAACLAGFNKYKKMICCVGHRGDEGKSLWSEVVQTIFSKEYFVDVGTAFYTGKDSTDANAHTRGLTGFQTACGILASEASSANSWFNILNLKKATGDDSMVHNEPYSKKAISFKVTAISFIVTNILPNMPDHAKRAAFERLFFLVFGSQFVHRNPDPSQHRYLINPLLKKKVKYLAQWMLMDVIDAYPRYMTYGFTLKSTGLQPYTCRLARSNYIQANYRYIRIFNYMVWQKCGGMQILPPRHSIEQLAIAVNDKQILFTEEDHKHANDAFVVHFGERSMYSYADMISSFMTICDLFNINYINDNNTLLVHLKTITFPGNVLRDNDPQLLIVEEPDSSVYILQHSIPDASEQPDLGVY